ncbi:MAG: Rpn family recombination-promoting nuclease/putative transposase [Blautia sp.]|nr:Rpn family recombination-promoting nuclease/putative transposase [Blautia sp.]
MGLKNQTYINYQMPYRTLMSDSVNYGRQVTDIEGTRGNEFREKATDIIGRPMTNDEYVGRFLKDDRICPVISLVVYTGDDPWDGPMCLRDMFVDSPLKPFANDYQMYLLDVKHMNDEELAAFSEPLQACLGMMRLSGAKEIKKYIEEKNDIFSNLPQPIWNTLLEMTDSKVFSLLWTTGRRKEKTTCVRDCRCTLTNRQ